VPLSTPWRRFPPTQTMENVFQDATVPLVNYCTQGSVYDRRTVRVSIRSSSTALDKLLTLTAITGSSVCLYVSQS